MTRLSTSPVQSAGAPERAARALPAQLKAGMLAQFPPRPLDEVWPETLLSRAEVCELVASHGFDATRYDSNRRGLQFLLDWLEDQPGHTWQGRWLASGADAAGRDWAAGPAEWLERHGLARARARYLAIALEALLGAGVVRPSLSWLLTGGKGHRLGFDTVRDRDRDGFARLHLACEADPAVTSVDEGHISLRCAVIIATKGGRLADITVGDVVELFDAEDHLKADPRSRPATFKVFREMGIFGAEVPAWRSLRRTGKLSVEELVDRYPIACRPMRDLLVAYLKERQPSVDYGTVVSLCYSLVRCFWSDLEAHHPGIDSLRLTPEVASAWKGRLRTKKVVARTASGASAERLNYLDVLYTVRAFYLDLAEWALEDPARWGPWVEPCPIRQHELSRRKFVRQRKARMDARTRERLPLLPQLVRSTQRWRNDAANILAAGRAAPPGGTFSAAGQSFVRSSLLRPRIEGHVWAQDQVSGKPKLLDREEEHAFWAWAVIEVFRFTELRVEELLELSHYSLVKYRLPTTGEVVPLLQVAPSKTDSERLLVVSPELAQVLSEVIRRVRGPDGAVRMVRAWDYHERAWLPPSPLLFQHRVGPEHKEFNIPFVNTLINDAIARTGLVGVDGHPVHFTPHDFRRMFITDAVMNGLPPHIAQVIAGHHDLNVTMGYKAVYPDEALQAHLAFLARRRALRPSDEYRSPTDEEWQAFFGHFERRKVSVGTCGRAFATPCIHEHACIRCALLWPDPSQRGRLVEIRDNIVARISEARHEGWFGEVEGLEVSLAGAENKLTQLEQRAARPLEESLAASG
ncbi:MAG: tyrosine-type recombinase/integrase [Acidimicrobiales bacterium]